MAAKQESASLSYAAAAIAATVSPSFGPLGLDQLLESSTGKVTITNSGSAILRSLSITDPVTRFLVDGACGHGASSSLSSSSSRLDGGAPRDGVTGLVLLVTATVRAAFALGGTSTCRGRIARALAPLPDELEPLMRAAAREVRGTPPDLARRDSPLARTVADLARTVLSGNVADVRLVGRARSVICIPPLLVYCMVYTCGQCIVLGLKDASTA